MAYRAEIDGLRAIAVGAVIAHHAGVPLPGGYLGVDIFFVISGFLITTILMREMATGDFASWQFYGRRARRILPALVVVSLVCVPLGWVFALPDQLTLLGQSLVALTGFATNILFWLKSGYFAPAADEIPLLHTWSLAVEEQFYLIFPLALTVLWGRRALVPALAGVMMLSFLAALWMQGVDRDAAFYLLPFRAWELLAGVLLALCAPRLPVAGAPIGLGLIVAGLILADPWSGLAPLWAVLPVVGTVLVIAAARPGTWVHWVLTRPPLIWIGLISYSLYLWHQPVFAFARMAAFLPPSPGQMAGLVLLTVVLAWATWAFVEQPFRDPRRIGGRTLWRGAAVAGAVLGGLGLVGHAGGGFGPQRFAPEVVAVLESAEPSPLRERCHFAPDRAPLPDAACVLFADAGPTWAVLGDSHGVELAHAIGAALADRGESLVQLTASACPPALTFDPGQKGCADWIARSVAWLEAAPDIHTVVLAWRHNVYLFGDNAGAYPGLPDVPFHIAVDGTGAQKRDAYWASLEALVARLSGHGRRVVFLDPVPEIALPIQKYALHGEWQGETLPTVPASYHAARTAWIRARLDALPVERLSAGPGCGTHCIGAEAGRALYFDDDHMSLGQAARYARALVAAPPALTLSEAGSTRPAPSPAQHPLR